MYAVLVCYNCGRLLLAKTNQKTRLCPHCESRLIIEKAKQLALSKSAREAAELMRAMKFKKEIRWQKL
jgi:DNA-directed RNA polymerase subunit RPC12/RpoP